MNFLKKKKKKARARAARADQKKGSFSAETRFFLLGNTKDLAAEGCSMSVSLLSIFIDSCVFCWSLDDRLLKIWPRVWKTWHRKQATDSHRQPYAATGSHRHTQKKRCIHVQAA